MTSPDLTEANISKLAELFPTVVTETIDEDGNPKRAIDFDMLRQELSDHVVEGPQERYQLDWPGKRAAAFAANAPIAKTLRPVREESVNFDTTKNLFIEGDNLEALKLLQESYLGKVKLIYIDPPYNTGNDFVYEDDFAESKPEYLAQSGQVSDTGERLVANTEANGRFHSDWLSMMYPRLKLARNLLRSDGVIFMSINDAEVENLKHLAGEVFGSSNFVGAMVWAAGRKNDSKFISSSHEYILCFARDFASLREQKVTWKVRKKGLDEIYKVAKKFVSEGRGDYDLASQKLKDWYRDLPDNSEAKRHKHYSRIDGRGVFFPGDISWPGGGGPKYEVLHPVTNLPVTVPSRGWLFQSPVMEKYIAEKRVHFGVDETAVPTFKRYLQDTEYEVAYSVFYQDVRAATKRLRELMGATVFDFPKDETVIQTLVQMTTSQDDLILDFFAGSGTTAHATLAANAADGGNRRYIMVQLDEQTPNKSIARENGYSSISEISRERIRRAGTKILDEATTDVSHLDTGFRSFRIDSSNLVSLLSSAENLEQNSLLGMISTVKRDRSSEDLLFQVFIDWGLDLDMPIKRDVFENHEIFKVEDSALVACFSEQLSENVITHIAKLTPIRAVFLDSAFKTDAARINAEQIFREISPDTGIKVI